VPGLPNMWLTPSSSSSRRKALRPVRVVFAMVAGF
jgi:hypothetical protein